MAKVLSIAELRRKTPQELQTLAARLGEELRVIRFELRVGQVRKVHQARQVRTSIAKVLTVAQELSRKTRS